MTKGAYSVQVKNNQTIEFVPNEFIGTANVYYELSSHEGVPLSVGVIKVETKAPTTNTESCIKNWKTLIGGTILLFTSLFILRILKSDR